MLATAAPPGFGMARSYSASQVSTTQRAVAPLRAPSTIHPNTISLLEQQAMMLGGAYSGAGPILGTTNEEISTIFVVGFPDDMQEREFQNMFMFSPEFEAATLKIPSYHQEEIELSQNSLNNTRKQIIGFAKFRSRLAALEARDVLNGRKVDAEKGSVLKAEMAKKNLHTKRGLSNDQANGNSTVSNYPLGSPSSTTSSRKPFQPTSAYEAFYSVPAVGACAPSLPSDLLSSPQDPHDYGFESSYGSSAPVAGFSNDGYHLSTPVTADFSEGPYSSSFTSFSEATRNRIGGLVTAQRSQLSSENFDAGPQQQDAQHLPLQGSPYQQQQQQHQQQRQPEQQQDQQHQSEQQIQQPSLHQSHHQINTLQHVPQPLSQSIPPQSIHSSTTQSHSSRLGAIRNFHLDLTDGYTSGSGDGVKGGGGGGVLGNRTFPNLCATVPQSAPPTENRGFNSSLFGNVGRECNYVESPAIESTDENNHFPGALHHHEQQQQHHQQHYQRQQQQPYQQQQQPQQQQTNGQQQQQLPQVISGLGFRMNALSINTAAANSGTSVQTQLGGMNAFSNSATGTLSPAFMPSPGLRSSNPGDQNPPCNTLYVGNLPPNTNEEELRMLFSKCLGYKRMCFRTKANGPMCFVEFDDVMCATQALHDLYGNPLSNSVKGGIRLSYSKNPLGVRQHPTFPTSAAVPHNNLYLSNGPLSAPLAASGNNPLFGFGPLSREVMGGFGSIYGSSLRGTTTPITSTKMTPTINGNSGGNVGSYASSLLREGMAIERTTSACSVGTIGQQPILLHQQQPPSLSVNTPAQSSSNLNNAVLTAVGSSSTRTESPWAHFNTTNTDLGGNHDFFSSSSSSSPSISPSARSSSSTTTSSTISSALQNTASTSVFATNTTATAHSITGPDYVASELLRTLSSQKASSPANDDAGSSSGDATFAADEAVAHAAAAIDFEENNPVKTEYKVYYASPLSQCAAADGNAAILVDAASTCFTGAEVSDR